MLGKIVAKQILEWCIAVNAALDIEDYIFCKGKSGGLVGCISYSKVAVIGWNIDLKFKCGNWRHGESGVSDSDSDLYLVFLSKAGEDVLESESESGKGSVQDSDLNLLVNKGYSVG